MRRIRGLSPKRPSSSSVKSRANREPLTGREVFRYDLLIMGFLCVLFLQIQLYTDSPFFLCLLPLFSLRYPFEVNGLNLRKCPKGEDGMREQEIEIYYRFIGKID